MGVCQIERNVTSFIFNEPLFLRWTWLPWQQRISIIRQWCACSAIDNHYDGSVYSSINVKGKKYCYSWIGVEINEQLYQRWLWEDLLFTISEISEVNLAQFKSLFFSWSIIYGLSKLITWLSQLISKSKVGSSWSVNVSKELLSWNSIKRQED